MSDRLVKRSNTTRSVSGIVKFSGAGPKPTFSILERRVFFLCRPLVSNHFQNITRVDAPWPLSSMDSVLAE